MPEGVLSPFLSRLSPQPLLSQAWPAQTRAECLLFLLSLCCCSAWQFIKGNTSFFLAPGRLISTAAEAVMADKRQQGPRITVHTHSICIYCVILPASDKGGGGEEEKMEDRLLHSCVFTLTRLIRERGGQTVYSEAINQPFSIRLSSTL